MIAKGILARKFFIGVSEYLGESLKRLRTYYEWKDEESIGCVNFFLDEYHKVEAAERSSLERGDAQWNLIATENNFDMELYYYALEVFTKQGSTMFHRPYVDKQGVPIDFAKLKKEREEKEEREREQREKNFWKEFDKLGKY